MEKEEEEKLLGTHIVRSMSRPEISWVRGAITGELACAACRYKR
jgi:hypothetical protein